MEASNVFYRGELRQVYHKMERGEGVYLFDAKGKKYLDAMSGVGVVNIGYGVQEVVDAITEQARKLPYCHTIRFTTQVQEDLAKRIAQISPPDLKKVFFAPSGAESNEVAIRFARKFHVETGNLYKHAVISRYQSFHGCTLFSLSVSGARNWRKDYPIPPALTDNPKIAPANCYRCPFKKSYPDCDLDCAYDLERVVNYLGSEYVAAFIAEPVVAGSQGATVPPPEYFKIIRSICNKYNVIFIVDEVFCGNGRTGKYFAIEHWDVSPDIIVSAKGIAGGYAPLAIVVAHEKIYDAIYHGSGIVGEGHTFSGHPVVCAAALATLDYMERNDLVERAAEMGNYLMKGLSSLYGFEMVGQIRGKGLMIGIEFVSDRTTKEPFDPTLEVSKRTAGIALEKGLVVLRGSGGADGVRGDHILVCPPLTISKTEADKIVEILGEVFEEVQETLGIK